MTMPKRSWFSGLFLIAFAVSLVHTSIPHTHPEKNDKPEVNAGSHQHNHGEHNHNSHDHDKHDHNSNDHGSHEHEQKSTLPVFSHFSNADFVKSSRYEFHAKETLFIQHLQPVILSVKLVDTLEKKFLFPRAREHPASRLASSQSFRAPPFHF